MGRGVFGEWVRQVAPTGLEERAVPTILRAVLYRTRKRMARLRELAQPKTWYLSPRTFFPLGGTRIRDILISYIGSECKKRSRESCGDLVRYTVTSAIILQKAGNNLYRFLLTVGCKFFPFKSCISGSERLDPHCPLQNIG
ncbi:hypothetical protein Zmor_009301 [Zophobas morio]|uniref:Uncharacterized protein n=1 Tax=Zophobas morio TaxID=2755281 RepID=A0AA38IKY4_9CUCU|nr:hypothetical protein Zmor_009301 [Zophobas morio]